MEMKTKFMNAIGKLPFFKTRSYPIMVEIIKPRANHLQFIPDRARKVKFIKATKGGMESWQLNLLYDKVDIQLPENYNFIMDHKGREKIYLLNPEPSVYINAVPLVDMDNKDIKLIVQIQGRIPWLLATLKKDSEELRPENKWLQYLPVVSLVLFGTFQIILFFLGTIRSAEQVDIMAQATSALTQALDRIAPLIPPP